MSMHMCHLHKLKFHSSDSCPECAHNHNKSLDEMMGESTKTFFSGATKAATVDEIVAAAEKVEDRYNRFLVITEKHLPDDCYGIFIVRPEDSAAFKNIK